MNKPKLLQLAQEIKDIVSSEGYYIHGYSSQSLQGATVVIVDPSTGLQVVCECSNQRSSPRLFKDMAPWSDSREMGEKTYSFVLFQRYQAITGSPQDGTEVIRDFYLGKCCACGKVHLGISVMQA